MEVLIAELAPLPAEARQSRTFDGGTEFSTWRRLEDRIGAAGWLCNPQAAWRKETVESTDGRLVKHLPHLTEPTAFKSVRKVDLPEHHFHALQVVLSEHSGDIRKQPDSPQKQIA